MGRPGSTGTSSSSGPSCCKCECPNCGRGVARRGPNVTRIFLCAGLDCNFESGSRAEVRSHQWEAHGTGDPWALDDGGGDPGGGEGEDDWRLCPPLAKRRRVAPGETSFDLLRWRVEDLPMRSCEVVLRRGAVARKVKGLSQRPKEDEEAEDQDWWLWDKDGEVLDGTRNESDGEEALAGIESNGGNDGNWSGGEDDTSFPEESSHSSTAPAAAVAAPPTQERRKNLVETECARKADELVAKLGLGSANGEESESEEEPDPLPPLKKRKTINRGGHKYKSTVLCDLCGHSSPSQRALEKHTEAMHGSYMCHECDYTTSSKRDLGIHLHKGHGEVCPDCKYPLKVYRESSGDHECPAQLGPGQVPPELEPLLLPREPSDIPRLSRLARKLSTGRYVCLRCGLTTRMLLTMRHHMRLRHCDYSCDQCSFQTTLRAALLRHTKYKHDLKCPTCGHEAMNEEELKVHFCDPSSRRDPDPLSGSDLLEGPKCPHCGLVATSVGNLKLHILHRHTKESHPCKFCDRVCKNKYVLAAHVRSVHTSFLTCDVPGCGFSTSYTRSFQRHKASHAKGVEHECPLEGCDYVTSAKGNLLRHRFEVHPETLSEVQRTKFEAKREAQQKAAEVIDMPKKKYHKGY